jgi:hypothetical protein
MQSGRGPDKGPRKKRSDKGKSRGPLSGVRQAVGEARARRRSRNKKEELELRLLESQVKDLGAREGKAKRKKLAMAGKLAAVGAGALALGTKKGRTLAGKGIKKATSEVGKAAKKTVGNVAEIAGRAVKERVKETAAETKKAVQEKVQETGQSIKQTVRNKSVADKAAIMDLVRRGQEKVQKDVETTKKFFRRRKKSTATKPAKASLTSQAPKANPHKRKKTFKERLVEKAEKDIALRKRILGFNLERVGAIEFAKKKKVKIRSYRRRDGTVVKNSTRSITKKERTLGQKIGDLGQGLIPVARAFTTVAAGVGTLSEARNRRRLVNRELSGIGEARKFLSLSSSVGSGFRGASLGVETLSNLGLKKNQMDLQKRKLNLAEDNLVDRVRRTRIYEDQVNRRQPEKQSYLWEELGFKQKQHKFKVKSRSKNKKKKKGES